MRGNKKGRMLSPLELSAFCTQIDLMLTSAIPLYDGLGLMAEDSRDETEKRMLLEFAEELELGTALFKVLEQSGCFPNYVIYMTQIGEESGNLDRIMKSLATYYHREDQVKKTIKDAVTYPIVMVFMMLIILFILMTKVMPVFEGVFAQLGTELPLFTRNAVSLGGTLTGICIVVVVAIVIISAIIGTLSNSKINIPLLARMKDFVQGKSKIFVSLEISRFCSVVSMMLQSGMNTSEVLELAKMVLSGKMISSKIEACEITFEESSNFVEALKDTGFFGGLQKQMLVVGNRTGHLDDILEELSMQYSDDVYLKINRAIAKFEPTIVAVLSVAVGLILLAVMLPLIGMMASM